MVDFFVKRSYWIQQNRASAADQVELPDNNITSFEPTYDLILPVDIIAEQDWLFAPFERFYAFEGGGDLLEVELGGSVSGRKCEQLHLGVTTHCEAHDFSVHAHQAVKRQSFDVFAQLRSLQEPEARCMLGPQAPHLELFFKTGAGGLLEAHGDQKVTAGRDLEEEEAAVVGVDSALNRESVIHIEDLDDSFN